MTSPFTFKPGPTSDTVVVADTHAGALLRVGQGAARIVRSDLYLLIRRLAESHGHLAVIELPQTPWDAPYLGEVEAFTSDAGLPCVRVHLFRPDLSQTEALSLAGAIVASAQQPPDPATVERAELATVIYNTAYDAMVNDPVMAAHANEVADAVLDWQRSKQA